MIQANELRTRNFVLLDGKHFARIECIDLRTNTVYTKNPYNKMLNGLTGDEWDVSSDFIQPIPLSPEILEACGFVWTANIHRWVHGCGYKVIQHDHGFDNGIGDASFSRPPLKHLHQLQNLFFALTGTELIINLEKVKV